MKFHTAMMYARSITGLPVYRKSLVIKNDMAPIVYWRGKWGWVERGLDLRTKKLTKTIYHYVPDDEDLVATDWNVMYKKENFTLYVRNNL